MSPKNIFLVKFGSKTLKFFVLIETKYVSVGLCVCVCVCVYLFPSTLKASPDWTKQWM